MIDRAFYFGLIGLMISSNISVADTPLDGEALYRDVEHFAGLGEHRTGSQQDIDTSQWLADSLTDAGFAVQQQPFALQQFFPEQQQLTIGKQHIAVFPHWFPQPTRGKLSATIVPMSDDDLNGHIAYLSPQQAGQWYRLQPAELAKAAAEKGALALIISPDHPSGEIYATNANAESRQTPTAIPTVITALADATTIEQAIAAKTTVELISTGSRRATTAYNVIGRYPATPIADAPWAVISTPTSGWFQTAGERGSGVALWLGMARYASQQPQHINWLFIANSGHELDFMGTEHSLALAPPAEQVSLWLHLGASIGARQWQQDGDQLTPLNTVHQYNHLYADSAVMALTQQSFADVPDLDILPASQLNRGHSELGSIINLGYKASGFVGSHRFFHSPGDTPKVTSTELLAPYGHAAEKLIQQLNQSPLLPSTTK
ncbi:hypothetical protein SIN8267_00095 [Sinobacterium norvegicum]|uniref:M28 family peptidase n=1 Tax=Sinobacterium norvegicum TaxID=1641715 RepID=A0ABN8ECB2_9GAMM|nr:hypothetical protein [Sinobacterium norvegicum]CAH0990013.1 hypothetical protein SIN8267_00095 [Sinobacterium norvegicum]